MSEQAAMWNGVAGRGWVEMQEVMDGILRPFEELLLDGVDAVGAGRVLDVGCGAGGTTLALARRLGGECTGIDISEPLLETARSRAERAGLPVEFIRADAQRFPFEPASYDLIVSRFGVMFFDDCAEAFANLHRAARPGGRLRFVSWRGPEENPFMTAAEQAAGSLVTLPPRLPDAPGPFALADPARVLAILEDGSWRAIDIRPVDPVCAFREADLMPYLMNVGPLARALGDADAATKERVVASVRPAFDPFVTGDEVRFTAAGWIVSALAQ